MPNKKNVEIVAAVCLLTLLVNIGAPDPTPPVAAVSARPSDDIHTYALFASEELSVKGNCHYNDGWDTGRIEGGNIGVAAPRDSNQSLPARLRSGHPIWMSPGSQVVGDYVDLWKLSEVGDVYANHLGDDITDGKVTMQNGPIPFALPILDSSNPEKAFPTFPTFTAGTQAVEVAQNGTLSLAPGSYGDLWVKNDGTLNLTHGIYTFNEFKLSLRSVVNVEDDTEVRIAAGLKFQDDSQVVGAGLAKFFVRGDTYNNNEKAVAFGWDPSFSGQLYHAATGEGVINLGDTGVFFGRFVGHHIDSDCDFNIQYRAPGGVRGRIYDDVSCNGTDNSEPPLSNVKVYLDCNNNNVLDEPTASEPYKAREMFGFTDSNGVFQFRGNISGTCKIRPVLDGRNCISPSPSCSYSVALGALGVIHDSNYVFGLTSAGNQQCGQTPSPDSFTGRILTKPYCGTGSPAATPVNGAQMFLDCNNNGTFDSGVNGEVSTTSDASGNFTITNAKVGLACKLTTAGVSGQKCSTPGESPNCYYNVTAGNSGQTYSGYTFVFVPQTDTTCGGGGGDEGGCTVSSRTQNSQGIDAHGYRLFLLSKEAVRQTRLMAKKLGKKLNPKKVKQIMTLADGNYKTLWGLAYNTFTTTVYECTGTAGLACEERSTIARQQQILGMADELIKQIKKTLGKKGAKRPKGKKILKAAADERAAIKAITDAFPSSYFVCNN